MGTAHWVYLAGAIVIIVTMILRQNVVVPAIVATLLTTWVFTGSFISGLGSIFNASLTAATELFSIFLVIALVTALLNALKTLQSDVRMVQPLRKVMVNGHVAFFALFAITWAISLFFWPTPAVPLVGAVLIPAAIIAGLPAMAAGVAIAVAGQGMALSSDYIIQVAPGLSATAAGVSTGAVADRALVLSLITGGVAIVTAYFLTVRKHIKPQNVTYLEYWEQGATMAKPFSLMSLEDRKSPDEAPETFAEQEVLARPADREPLGAEEDVEAAEESLPRSKEKWSKAFAIIVPLALAAVVVYMVASKLSERIPDLEGTAAAALVGGVATLVMLFAAAARDERAFLKTAADHVVDGLLFAFRAMGVVLPIAGFFFIGNPDFSASIMGLGEDAEGPSLLFDLVEAGQTLIPASGFLMAFGILIIGMVTGLDGSGFSGLPLTGSLAGALGPQVGTDPATLAAIGQMGSIWVGGGTLVAWSSLVAVAGFARVPVVELAGKLFLPVILGLVVSTIVAVLLY